MKKNHLSLLLVFAWFMALAKTENPSPVYFLPKLLGEATTTPLHKKIYDSDYFNEDGTSKTAPSGMRLKQNSIMATLFIDPFQSKPSASAYSITVECSFSYKTITSGSLLPPKTIRLSVSYDPASATFKSKDYFTLPNAAWADITITKIISAPATFAENDSTFRLYLQYQAEKFIVPTSAQLNVPPVVTDFKASRNNGYMRLSWQRPEPDWAERYDVEYLFVDSYDGNGGTKPASSIPYNFRFNSTRVSTTNTELEIPMVYEQGYVVARVRAIGMQGTAYDEPVYGKWDLATAANSIPADTKHAFQVNAVSVHEGDKMNWKYTGTFAGDDQHKEGIAYMDGTMRPRQTVSTAHTDHNLLVAETIYDHQGRPAIQTIPAPVKPVYSAPATSSTGGGGIGSIGGLSIGEIVSPVTPVLPAGITLTTDVLMNIFSYRSTQPRLGYQRNFNLNSAGQPYSKLNFDTDRENDCAISAEPFSTASGAGKYYSAANSDQTGFNAFIPDAEGYPFTQLTYTPDKTDRLAVVAKAGAELKLGSGHEQKMYYGSPSQDELDRMFGNDAGDAAQYKKEMQIDENGQAHVTYKDFKGNIVATALAGDAPAAFEPVPQGDAITVTLHLIEEDNRIDEASKSLVSQKSLLLSKNTNVNFSYRLTPPTYRGNYCNGTSFCYDCVYNLEIVVRNACGDSVWGNRQTIGTLTPVNTCSSTEVTVSGTQPNLPAGNYFISKRLTVNTEAVEQYLLDFRTRYMCPQPLQSYLPAAGLGTATDPCNQPCNLCSQLPVEPARSYAMTQPDGSTRMVTMPVNRRTTGNGDCVRFCNTASPSPCATALEAMLADVSPGGQYGEYLDTTRKDAANPRGLFYAKAFPLSVLNDSANSLPVRNANWRNPVYDYQNKDGSIAYIELSADGLPSHLEIDVIERDGKRLVKPRYLNLVSDFVRYWQPQWAEALVVYHPEYGYYAWCINHQSSYEYDNQMKATRSYTDAAARSMINHRSAGLSADPFFRDGLPADAAAMATALNNFAPLAGYPDLNIDEAVYMAVNCNNVNFSLPEANNCARGKALYLNTGTANKEWEFYKEFYLLKKHRVHDNARRNWISAGSYFENSQIGTNSFGAVANPLYGDRVKRFNDSYDGLTYLPVDIDTVTSETLYAWRDAATQETQRTCGGCGSSYELTAFLNALAIEKKLQQSLTLPAVTPLAFSKGMTRLFNDSLATRYTWATNATPSSLRFTISTARGEQCVINLSKTAVYNWDSIIALDCFTAVNTNEFTLRARTAIDSTFTITGNSSCMNFRNCPPAKVCVKLEAADDMAVLMKYLFQRNRYRSTSLILRGRTGYTPYLGAALRSYSANATRWEWKMKTISFPDTAMTAEIAITNPPVIVNGVPTNPIIVRCDFILRVLTPGYRLSQVADITDISRPANATACSVFDFVLTAKTSTGATFKIYGQSCYKLFDCCHNNNNVAPTGVCCIPVMPKFDVARTCLRDAEAVANNNRARDEENRLLAATDSFRTNYIAHCLGAVEEFNASYNDAIYQITLMYYDRSGQLVKTVPPAGVRLLTAGQVESARLARISGTGAVYPPHTFISTYRYNSFNRMVQKTTPDEGATRYCYDQSGRVVMIQDAAQLSANTCTYMLYDAVGRRVETGRRNFSGAIPGFMAYETFRDGLPSAGKAEVKRTQYDEMPATVISRFPSAPKNLRNRIAAIESYETATALAHAMYFDYDAAGNTKNILQNFKAIATGDGSKFWKKISYDYNRLTGAVKTAWYQRGQTDQLIHWYQYDGDGRILSVQTGTNPLELETMRETEAKYFYYPHGPVARVEIGTEKIQGIDYAYTINGLPKAINSGNASKDFDMGEDGKPEGELHGHFPQDVYGESLTYFGNDYQSISSTATPFATAVTGSALETGFSKPVYNGFIQNTVSAIPAIDTKPGARAYKYDQMGRLSHMQMITDAGATTSNAISAGFSEDYKTQLTYDPNGNISTLLRNKSAGAGMDNLTYGLQPGNNRLDHIRDAVTGTSANDLGTQAAGNYTYDAAGRLKTDVTGGISNLVWNNTSTVKRIEKAGGTIEYGYDGFGRRAWKRTGTGTEFYVRDAVGNSMAAYTVSGGDVTCTALDVYGANRLGRYQLTKLVEPSASDTGSFRRGLKRYEISNHTGDVQAVVSDRRLRIGDEVKADVIQATDYYPFGMPMPGRSFGTSNYRYGYQGMECEDDVAGNDNAYNTEFRQYDPRVGRWLSADPKAMNFFSLSPYNAMFNNPVNYTDRRGADPDEDRTRGVRLRPEDERFLAEMAEWGDDPIAGIEEPPVDDIDALCILLRRLEGNDDPLAGMPMEDATEPEPPVRHRVRTGRPHRRHTTVEVEAAQVDETIEGFEDDVVIVTRGTTPVEERPSDGTIVREMIENAGTVTDVGGVINDAVALSDALNDARSAGAPITAGTALRGAMDMRGPAGGMAVVGAVISTGGMLVEIWDDANLLVDGDISTGTYAVRSGCNIIGGAGGVVPVAGVVISHGMAEFRDWVAPRPER